MEDTIKLQSRVGKIPTLWTEAICGLKLGVHKMAKICPPQIYVETALTIAVVNEKTRTVVTTSRANKDEATKTVKGNQEDLVEETSAINIPTLTIKTATG